MMKMYSDREIDNMGKGQLNVFFKKLQKEYEDLQNDYDNLDDDYGEMERKIYDLQTEVDTLEGQIDNLKSGILDIDLFKDKLELYELYTEEMKEFLDLYLKLYNNEE